MVPWNMKLGLKPRIGKTLNENICCLLESRNVYHFNLVTSSLITRLASSKILLHWSHAIIGGVWRKIFRSLKIWQSQRTFVHWMPIPYTQLQCYFLKLLFASWMTRTLVYSQRIHIATNGSLIIWISILIGICISKTFRIVNTMCMSTFDIS